MWRDWLGALASKAGLVDPGGRRGDAAAATAPSRVGFIHVMKTAGTFVDSYLRECVLGPRGYRIENSWVSGREADWTSAELERFRVECSSAAMYVHNHVGDWPADVVRSFLDDGWFLFSFVRHPGDQWCSYYYWGRDEARRYHPERSVDEFLRRCFTPGGAPKRHRAMDVPAYWRHLSFVDEYSDESFAWMLATHFGHRFAAGSMAKTNTSDNPGYARCLAEGLVSDSTDRLIRGSEHYAVYEEIIAAARAKRSAG